MTAFRKPSIAFAAGAFGSIILFLIVYLLIAGGIMRVPANLAASFQSKAFLYRIIVWGGIWALALVLPVLEKQWWLRGIVLGVIVSLANMFYFTPSLQGAPALMVAFLFILNMVWGFAAAFWYAHVARG